MTILERIIIYGGYVALIIIGVAITFMPDTPDIPKTEYIEEPFTKADGTPCTIIRQTKMYKGTIVKPRLQYGLAITCDYGATQSPR
jgi:hypothetical protein